MTTYSNKTFLIVCVGQWNTETWAPHSNYQAFFRYLWNLNTSGYSCRHGVHPWIHTYIADECFPACVFSVMLYSWLRRWLALGWTHTEYGGEQLLCVCVCVVFTLSSQPSSSHRFRHYYFNIVSSCVLGVKHGHYCSILGFSVGWAVFITVDSFIPHFLMHGPLTLISKSHRITCGFVPAQTFEYV